MRRKIFDAIHDGQGNGNDMAKNMSVLQAIHLSYNAWMEVTTLCIANCIKKAGIVPITTTIANYEAPELNLPDESADFFQDSK